MADVCKHATDVAHCDADSFRTVCHNNASATKSAEQRFNDLCCNWIVLCKQTCHGAITRVWTSLEVDGSHRRWGSSDFDMARCGVTDGGRPRVG
jgi:hypothetical protein